MMYRVKLKRVLQGESCSWIRLSAYALLGWVIASIGLQLYFNPSSRSWLDPQYWTALKKVGESMRLAEANYYDSNKSSFEKLSKLAISGMTQSLDRHSAYYDTSEFNHFEENMHMRYAGIGIKIRSSKQGILITKIFKNSPAQEVGLLAGDQILEADNHLLEGMNIDEVGEIIRGEPDTLVSLKIRGLDGRDRLCSVLRKKIEMSSVDNWWVDENKTAYLKISQFTHRTQIEVEDVLQSIQALGARCLILDLRDNGGGLLDSAVEVAGNFLSPEKTVVSLSGRSPDKNRIYKPSSVRDPLGIPLVVLINQGSASGAELLAGALSKHGRAKLVGETSYGKGSVQSIYQMSDDSGLRLTTAKYYLPDDSTIHEKGIDPDYLVECSDEDAAKLSTQNDLLRTLDKNQAESLLGFALLADQQLHKAIEVVRGSLIREN